MLLPNPSDLGHELLISKTSAAETICFQDNTDPDPPQYLGPQLLLISMGVSLLNTLEDLGHYSPISTFLFRRAPLA